MDGYDELEWSVAVLKLFGIGKPRTPRPELCRYGADFMPARHFPNAGRIIDEVIMVVIEGELSDSSRDYEVIVFRVGICLADLPEV